MDIPAVFRRSVAEFGTRAGQIGDHQWQAATPDEGWTVRDLVNHVVGEDLWAPPLLAGSTIAEVGDRFDGDVLGAEPRAAWAAASAGAVRAVEENGAMDRIVHLSFGDFPGREYTLQLFADHLIHAWDLARAIGADERLDRGLRRVLRELVRGRGGCLPRRGSDRRAAAGGRRRGRPDCAAGLFRAACLTLGRARPRSCVIARCRGGTAPRTQGGRHGIRRDRGGRRVHWLRGRGPPQRGRALQRAAGRGPAFLPVAAGLPADIADESMPAASHDWGFASEPDELGHSIPAAPGTPGQRLLGD